MKKLKSNMDITPRSAAFEYLTFIATTGEGGVDVVYADENSVIRKFRITAIDGKEYETNHYSLETTIAVGNKVNSPKQIRYVFSSGIKQQRGIV
jgi:hypothetical protein